MNLIWNACNINHIVSEARFDGAICFRCYVARFPWEENLFYLNVYCDEFHIVCKTEYTSIDEAQKEALPIIKKKLSRRYQISIDESEKIREQMLLAHL